ncbi:MAG TPA: hypothetical protein VFR84_02565 [Candidatus Angelobacter sp.]|nr:hypothetical protein [Candidatus Angelobacter sp.]
MNHNEKWLAAAAGLEEDILYLRAALQSASRHAASGLRQSIERLQLAVAVFQENAASGMQWPSRDQLFSIHLRPCAAVTTGLRRPFKFAN